MLKFAPRWSTLQGAGNSRFSRLTVLTPVFGYIILYVDFFRNISKFSYGEIEFVAKIHAPISIYFIYFGLCIFSVGVIIYQTLCSEIVKRYEDHIAYILAVAPNISHFDCDYILRAIVGYKLTDEDVRSQARVLLTSISLSPEVSRENKIFILTQYYHMFNMDKPWGRLISTALLATGALLIALPTVITFGAVVGSLWH